MLTPWRRHVKTCPHRSDGRKYTKCSCPIWCDGEVSGERIRKSLDTRNWARAIRLLAEIEQNASDGKREKTFTEACDAFIVQWTGEPSTALKYARWSRYLQAFAERRGIEQVSDWTLEDLDAYRAERAVAPLTWSKELQFLRQLFGWFIARKWTQENPAKAMRMPPEPKPADRVPYTCQEVAAILRACDEFGRHPYERLRAKAMILLMRKYGLRISDAATLRRDRVTDGQILIRAQKNGSTVWAPLYPEVADALDRLPVPRNAPASAPYYFWAGEQSSTAVNFVKTMERTLKSVFDASGVANAHAHRFRHTLATELMVAGGTVEDVANILGDDPETIRRYYLKWSREYQERTSRLLDRVHSGTSAAHKKNSLASGLESIDSLVAKVGVESPKPTKKQ